MTTTVDANTRPSDALCYTSFPDQVHLRLVSGLRYTFYHSFSYVLPLAFDDRPHKVRQSRKIGVNLGETVDVPLHAPRDEELFKVKHDTSDPGSRNITRERVF